MNDQTVGTITNYNQIMDRVWINDDNGIRCLRVRGCIVTLYIYNFGLAGYIISDQYYNSITYSQFDEVEVINIIYLVENSDITDISIDELYRVRNIDLQNL